jgi:hypothetical protein
LINRFEKGTASQAAEKSLWQLILGGAALQGCDKAFVSIDGFSR